MECEICGREAELTLLSVKGMILLCRECLINFMVQYYDWNDKDINEYLGSYKINYANF